MCLPAVNQPRKRVHTPLAPPPHRDHDRYPTVYPHPRGPKMPKIGLGRVKLQNTSSVDVFADNAALRIVESQNTFTTDVVLDSICGARSAQGDNCASLCRGLKKGLPRGAKRPQRGPLSKETPSQDAPPRGFVFTRGLKESASGAKQQMSFEAFRTTCVLLEFVDRPK